MSAYVENSGAALNIFLQNTVDVSFPDLSLNNVTLNKIVWIIDIKCTQDFYPMLGVYVDREGG